MFKNIFDKNTLLAILLIFGMVFTYIRYQKSRIETIANEEKIHQAFNAKDSVISKPNETKIATKNEPALAVENDTITPTGGERITLSNNLVSISINTIGAAIQNGVLSKHKTYTNQSITLLGDKSTKQFFIFNQISTKNLVFKVVNKSDNSLTLESNSGLKVSFSLDSNSYMLRQKWSSAEKINSAKLSLEAELNRQETNLQRERQYSTIYYLRQGEDVVTSLSTTSNESIDEPKQMNWVSFGQQFFNTTIIPKAGFTSSKMNTFYLETDTGYVKKYKLDASLNISENIDVDYFIGPSEYKQLKKENKDLDLIVPLSQNFLLLRWMKIFNIYLIIPIFEFFSKFFSNYGVIILLLTLFIKLITAPLSYKTYKSGIAMKILKPELDKLRKKHGDDQQKYAQDQMKLFGEYGVSPFGGCLPMLLQMPILFAMFNFFPAAVELRHQEFLWAKDLSTFDSFLTLPFNIPFYGSHVSLFALLSSLTQIGTSVYAQRLQPSSPQADQMKMMMYIMPIMFLFMFNSFPAALTFYYFLQNILSIIQQWIFTTFIIKEDAVKAEMEFTKKNPKKQSGFSKKMQDLMDQAEQQKKLQQNQTKK